jgi:hypothetical protein
MNGSAQTGIFYYSPENLQNMHAKIIDIVETEYSQLILLTSTHEMNYKNPQMIYIIADNAGKNNLSKQIPIENLYDLTALKKVSPNKNIVFGNLTLNKQYQPFHLSIDNQGQTGKMDKESSVFSTLTSSVIEANGYIYILYTKNGKNERYNISLHKIEASTNKVMWLKKISSEQNEEGSQIQIANNGNIFILGKKYNDKVSDYLPVMYKLNPEGEQIWKKGIEVPNNFNSQSFFVLPNEELIYFCSYTKNQSGFSETRLTHLSSLGDEKSYNSINEFSANGMIFLKSQKILLYGSRFYVNQKQVITKAGYLLATPNLMSDFTKILDANDKPDADLNLNWQTSSDFTAAQELSDGRIALGGKVFMPNKNNTKHNSPLLMLINADGSYQK